MNFPITYHDYIFVCACFDGEWTRFATEQGANGSGAAASMPAARKVIKDYEEFCAKEFKTVSLNELERFANPALFSVRGFVPFSHADALCCVLADDLDTAQVITAEFPQTVEEVNLGFCPQVGPLLREVFTEGSDEHTLARSIWVEPEKIFREDAGSLPLMAVIRLKLSAALSLGLCLQNQSAVFMALIRQGLIAYQTLETLALLADDAPAVRLCLLDLQDEEEVAVLAFGSDYTTLMSLGSAFRSMPFSCLDRGTAHYGKALAESDFIQSLVPGVDFNAFSGNHVFRWSRTTLAAIPDAFEPGYDKVSGFVFPSVAVSIPPGHEQDAAHFLKLIYHDQAQAAVTHPYPQLIAEDGSEIGWRLALAGHEDKLLVPAAFQPGPRAAFSQLVSLPWFLQTSGKVALEHADASMDKHGRLLSGWTTSLAVPVPCCPPFGLTTGELHIPMFQAFLLKAKRDIFAKDGPFCLTRLRGMTRTYGLPVSLRRNIFLLYSNVAGILGSPNTFDLAIDFWDPLLTLYEILTKHLPQAVKKRDADILKSGPAFRVVQPSLLDEAQVTDLADYIEALNASLDLRMRRVFPEMPVRDWAIDFRSSLNQIVSAAEAVLRCAISLPRIHLLEKRNDYNLFGVVLQLSFKPGMTYKSCAVGADDDARLIYFSGDISHLMQPSSLINYFHEAFHAVYTELEKPRSNCFYPPLQLLPPAPGRSNPALEADEDDTNLLRELFSVLCTFLFVFQSGNREDFDGDIQLFARHRAIDFSSNLLASKGTRKGWLTNMAEFQVTTGIVQWLARHAFEAGKNDDLPIWRFLFPPAGFTDQKIEEMADRACESFEADLAAAATLIADFECLGDGISPGWGTSAKSFLRGRFRVYFVKLLSEFGVHWNAACRLYQGYLLDLFHEKNEEASPSYLDLTDAKSEFPSALRKAKWAAATAWRRQMRAHCQHALTMGSPVTHLHFTETADGPALPPESRINPDEGIMIIAETLRFFVQNFLPDAGTGDMDPMLRRNITTGIVGMPDGDRKAKYLVNPSYPNLFSNRTADRRARVKSQIAVIKTLWGLAGRVRKHRFLALKKLMSAAETSTQIDPQEQSEH